MAAPSSGLGAAALPAPCVTAGSRPREKGGRDGGVRPRVVKRVGGADALTGGKTRRFPTSRGETRAPRRETASSPGRPLHPPREPPHTQGTPHAHR